MADDGRQLVLQRTELGRTASVAGAGMVWLGGDQVAACHKFVALDGGVVVDSPAILIECFGGVEGQPVEIKHIE